MDFKNIVFPVDFSAHCEAAIPQVKAMAKLFDSSICLLHVVEYPAPYTSEVPVIPEAHWDEMRERAARRLSETVDLAFGDCRVTTIVKQGDTAAEITALAEDRKASLIMMPTHGTGRFRAALLGSVTGKVLHDADRPVWTSAHPESNDPGLSEPGAPGRFRSILCAVDFGPGNRALVSAAAEFGARTGATVRLVHAVPGEENPLQHTMNMEFELYLKDCARASAARLQLEVGTAFEVYLEAGKPSRVIAEAARQHLSDLVVIGRGRIRGFAGQLCTEAYSIIRNSPCAVLSL